MNTHIQKPKRSQKLFGFTYNVEGKGRAYYFLLIDSLKQTLLETKLKQDNPFTVSDYGIVVASGYGMPSEDDKNLLRDKYGADI